MTAVHAGDGDGGSADTNSGNRTIIIHGGDRRIRAGPNHRLIRITIGQHSGGQGGGITGVQAQTLLIQRNPLYGIQHINAAMDGLELYHIKIVVVDVVLTAKLKSESG